MNAQLDLKLKEAVSRFWASRETQAQKQGAKSGIRDSGARAAVTGGSQMDGFVELVRDLLRSPASIGLSSIANGVWNSQAGSGQRRNGIS